MMKTASTAVVGAMVIAMSGSSSQSFVGRRPHASLPCPHALDARGVRSNSHFPQPRLRGHGNALQAQVGHDRGKTVVSATSFAAVAASASMVAAVAMPRRRVERRSLASAFVGCLFAGVLVAAAGSDAASAADGSTFMRQGMKQFVAGDVDGSIRLFDKAAEAGYPKALLWQRGLSLYYADKFGEGAEQFRKDVEMNPNDTEESIWAMLCEARTLGFDEARQRMLKVGRDRRNVMRTVYSLFRGEDEQGALSSLEKSAAGGGSDEFYASLYLGLFAEAKGNAQEARKWIDKSVASEYGRSSGDYMADLARVHQVLRKQGSKGEAAEL